MHGLDAPTNARLQQDFAQVRDITIIGAGPIGLSAAFWAGMRQASVRIVESLTAIGGQLTTLYPEKWIFDVCGYPRIVAKDLVDQLREQSIEQFDVPVHLGTTVKRMAYEPDPDDAGARLVRLTTDRGDLLTRAVVIAGGHGAFEPKKLPNLDLDPWEGRGVHYVVTEKAVFTGKNVVIVGGGDSACDWALNLLDTAESVVLVHRRDQFRAHEGVVADVMTAKKNGKIDVYTPHQVKELLGRESLEAVTLAGGPDNAQTTVPCDALLLQLGFKTALGPLADWGLDVEKGAILVSRLMETNLEGVWAAGDITTFDGKLKLIATGFAEAAMAVAQAVHHIRPEVKLQPKYSTNTGVPGADGQ